MGKMLAIKKNKKNELLDFFACNIQYSMAVHFRFSSYISAVTLGLQPQPNMVHILT